MLPPVMGRLLPAFGKGFFIACAMTEKENQTQEVIQFWTVNRDPKKRALVAIDICDDWVLNRRWFAAWRNGKLRYIQQSCNTDGCCGKPIHRLILKPDKSRIIDHIDMNPANNRRNNLRLCNNAENGRNLYLQQNNTSGRKGVSWDERRGKWDARIKLDRKQYFLGYFRNIEDAHAAYCQAAKRLHGEFARFSAATQPS